MTCEAVGRLLPFLLYGELSFDEEETVHNHLETCSECQSQFVKTTALHRSLDNAELEPEPAMLLNCRRNLRVATAAIAESGGPRRSWFDWLRLSAPRWDWFGKPATALALIAAGFFGGRLVPADSTSPGLAGAVASRVRFVEPREAGQVQIVLEETRQRTLSGDMEDDGIRTLLLRAARESSDPGVRVGTMDLLKAQSESEEVRGALLHALRHDTNAGVRLKALEALRASAGEADTRRVLAEVLLKDQNPGVRTQAVDLLTQKRAPELVGTLQEILTREDNNYVRMKVQRALADMNASAETF